MPHRKSRPSQILVGVLVAATQTWPQSAECSRAERPSEGRQKPQISRHHVQAGANEMQGRETGVAGMEAVAEKPELQGW